MEKYTWIRITGAGIVSKTPACVGAVHFVGDGSHQIDITLYDGESTDDPQILKLIGDKDNSKHITFTPYLKTNRGLYISFGTYTAAVLVQLATTYE